MDEDGYIPLVFFYNLPAVGALNPDYYGLLESLTSSSVIDVNMEHETLRLKQGWETVSDMTTKRFKNNYCALICFN